MITKIISGAQTGADQGGLDAALYLGLEAGGWIPKGRRTENGPMPIEQFKKYNLIECSTRKYRDRTKYNIANSDGTAIFGNMRSTGSSLTIDFCEMADKPYIQNPIFQDLSKWIEEFNIRIFEYCWQSRECKSWHSR